MPEKLRYLVGYLTAEEQGQRAAKVHGEQKDIGFFNRPAVQHRPVREYHEPEPQR